ncbi:hypothetical protein [Streptomyces thioluteus]|uniref:hypothetical protein n=1 Tax=Streptomyces thioluteus TaxID=66431 RepID=UPI0031EA6EA5
MRIKIGQRHLVVEGCGTVLAVLVLAVSLLFLLWALFSVATASDHLYSAPRPTARIDLNRNLI